MPSRKDADRARISRACDHCKRSRRKCDGDDPCSECQRRGVSCTFSIINKPRGPKPGSISETRAENDRLQAEVKLLRSQLNSANARVSSLERSLAAAQAAAASQAAGSGSRHSALHPSVAALAADGGLAPGQDWPREASSTQGTPLGPPPARPPASSSTASSSASGASAAASTGLPPSPGAVMKLEPLRPSADEHKYLSNFMRFIVRHFPVINRQAFLTDLARHQDPGASTTTVAVDAESVKKRLEDLSFRVCYYTALTFGAKLSGKRRLARRYYELARFHIGPCFAMPCQHLVSALLIMTILTRVILADIKQAILYASLAARMVDLCDVAPEIRICAMTMHAIINPAISRTWPSAECPEGMSHEVRLASLWAFIHGQVMHGLTLVRTRSDAERFENLMDECTTMQRTHGIGVQMAISTFTMAFKSFLQLRLGNTDAACVYARECVRLTLADEYTRFFVPLLYTARKAIAILAEFGTPRDAADLIPKAMDLFRRAADTIGATPMAQRLRKGLGSAEAELKEQTGEGSLLVSTMAREAAGAINSSGYDMGVSEPADLTEAFERKDAAEAAEGTAQAAAAANLVLSGGEGGGDKKAAAWARSPWLGVNSLPVAGAATKTASGRQYWDEDHSDGEGDAVPAASDAADPAATASAGQPLGPQVSRRVAVSMGTAPSLPWTQGASASHVTTEDFATRATQRGQRPGDDLVGLPAVVVNGSISHPGELHMASVIEEIRQRRLTGQFHGPVLSPAQQAILDHHRKRMVGEPCGGARRKRPREQESKTAEGAAEPEDDDEEEEEDDEDTGARGCHGHHRLCGDLSDPQSRARQMIRMMVNTVDDTESPAKRSKRDAEAAAAAAKAIAEAPLAADANAAVLAATMAAEEAIRRPEPPLTSSRRASHPAAASRDDPCVTEDVMQDLPADKMARVRRVAATMRQLSETMRTGQEGEATAMLTRPAGSLPVESRFQHHIGSSGAAFRHHPQGPRAAAVSMPPGPAAAFAAAAAGRFTASGQMGSFVSPSPLARDRSGPLAGHPAPGLAHGLSIQAPSLPAYAPHSRQQGVTTSSSSSSSSSAAAAAAAAAAGSFAAAQVQGQNVVRSDPADALATLAHVAGSAGKRSPAPQHSSGRVRKASVTSASSPQLAIPRLTSSGAVPLPDDGPGPAGGRLSRMSGGQYSPGGLSLGSSMGLTPLGLGDMLSDRPGSQRSLVGQWRNLTATPAGLAGSVTSSGSDHTSSRDPDSRDGPPGLAAGQDLTGQRRRPASRASASRLSVGSTDIFSGLIPGGDASFFDPPMQVSSGLPVAVQPTIIKPAPGPPPR